MSRAQRTISEKKCAKKRQTLSKSPPTNLANLSPKTFLSPHFRFDATRRQQLRKSLPLGATNLAVVPYMTVFIAIATHFICRAVCALCVQKWTREQKLASRPRSDGANFESRV